MYSSLTFKSRGERRDDIFFTVPLVVDRTLQRPSRSLGRFPTPTFVSHSSQLVESVPSDIESPPRGDVHDVDRQLISLGTVIAREIKAGLFAREPIGRIVARQIVTGRSDRNGNADANANATDRGSRLRGTRSRSANARAELRRACTRVTRREVCRISDAFRSITLPARFFLVSRTSPLSAQSN